MRLRLTHSWQPYPGLDLQALATWRPFFQQPQRTRALCHAYSSLLRSRSQRCIDGSKRLPVECAMVAAMYVPIALALYTLTNKSTPSPKLGTLLMVTIAVGCMIGGPMSPTGGARNALMIGFLADYGIPVSFMEWISMGVMYTIVMSVVMAFLLPMLFKPEVDDLSEAVGLLKKDLEKHGAMTNKQKLVAGIMALVVVMWITDKSLVKNILGFSLGLGGIAITGAVLYMLFGFERRACDTNQILRFSLLDYRWERVKCVGDKERG